MTSSWKSIVVLGLIVGFIAGIVQYVSHLTVLAFGIPYDYQPLPGAPINNMALYYVTLFLIFGLIYAIIFWKAYGVIPGKKISKGLCFGLAIFVFSAVRDVSFWVAYAVPVVTMVGWIFISFFPAIVYGILLGALYKRDVESVGKFDFGKGFQIGAIAGLSGGTAAFLSAVPLNMLLWKLPMEADVIMSTAVNHITINAFWGIVFGIVFTKVFDLVPGKGVLKGLVYGLITFLMASGHTITYFFMLGDFASVIHTGIVGGLQVIVFGLVLGYLYRKPSE